MKKLLLLSVLGLPLLAVTPERASAFVNFKFGIGMNLEYTSGGNCCLWGLWKNGPGPGYGYGPPGGMPYGGPFYGPMPADAGFMPAGDFGHGVSAPADLHPIQYNSPSYGGSYQPISYPASGWYGW
jgi:hypothetical protein